MPSGQDNRLIRWTGSAASDFALISLTGEEHLSQIYCYRTCSHSVLTSNQAARYLGKSVACQIGDMQRGRYINGVVTSMEEVNNAQGISTYEIIIEPQLALLRLGRNMRVFQKITVPDLVSKILRDHNITQVDLRLRGNYEPREYCIQYRESDYDFINRLLSQEGIYYYFLHGHDHHTMVLADHPSSHTNATTASLPFNPVAGKQEGVGVLSWTVRHGISAGGVLLSGYSPQQAAPVEGTSLSIDARHSINGITFTDAVWSPRREELSVAARLKMECLESHTQIFTGEINAYWLSCGERFALTDHPSASGQYRIHSLTMSVSSNLDQNNTNYQCLITALDNEKVYRPEAQILKPSIPGVMTATVVGPSSEEIYTDDQGRVKIQFPWDKENHHDDSSSCWVRVAQAWSGDRFGTVFLPRVGSEVIVSFVQGDPDMPVVTGSVFNGRNKLPLNLPGEKMLSGFVSRSTQHGSVNDGHTLSFDDKKGEEKLTIIAQKDLSLTVKNEVVSDIAKTVTSKIGADRCVEITRGNDNLTLKQGNYKLALEKGNISFNAVGNMNIALSNGNYKFSASGGSCEMKSDKSMSLESLQSIELKVGSSRISITPTGITLSATSLNIEGTGTAELKGAMVTVKGSGMTMLKGGVIMIG